MLFTGVWFDEFYSTSLHTGCQCTNTICTCYGIDVGTQSATAPNGNRIVVIVDRYDREPFPQFTVKSTVRQRDPEDLPPVYSAVDASRLRRTRSYFARSGITKAVPAGRERGHAFGHSPRVRSRH